MLGFQVKLQHNNHRSLMDVHICFSPAIWIMFHKLVVADCQRTKHLRTRILRTLCCKKKGAYLNDSAEGL